MIEPIKLKRFLLHFLFTFALASPIAAHFLTSYPDTDRYFPLWKNDLFANTPEVANGFEIKIYRLNGEVFEDGKYMYSLMPTLDWENFSASVVVDMMGSTFLSRDLNRFREMQASLERNKFYKFDLVEYGLVQVKWRPLDRYLQNKLIEENELARYVYEKSKI